MQRIAFLLLLSLVCSLCWPACYADTPACVTNTTLLQATTSTPAQVTGARGEHLALHTYHPQYDPRRQRALAHMYLITGDAVEVIANCDGFAYVRYQGTKLVSTGWVEKARLQTIGVPHVRPHDTVAQLCAATANIVNDNGADGGSFFLARLPLAPTPTGMLEKITRAAANDDPSGDTTVGNIDGAARIVVDGKAQKVLSIEDGGTCPSNYLQVWSDDLVKPITQTAQTEANLHFGDSQELVQVLGHPLVLQTNHGDRTKKFSLASLDKYGNLKTICIGQRRFTQRPSDVSSRWPQLCRAVASNHVTAIPLNIVDDKGIVLPSDTRERYSSAFALVGAARADLYNEGKPHGVGMITVHYDSSSGCGGSTDAEFPVLLNADGVADLTKPTNRELIKLVTRANDLDAEGLYSPGGAKLISYGGNVYLVTYAEPIATSDQGLTGVVRLTATTSQQICSFQPYQFEVTPTAGLESQVLP